MGSSNSGSDDDDENGSRKKSGKREEERSMEFDISIKLDVRAERCSRGSGVSKDAKWV